MIFEGGRAAIRRSVGALFSSDGDSRLLRLENGPFRRSFIRWHELYFIITLSLFANIAAGLRFDIHGSYTLFCANSLLFISALGSFNVYRIMAETWDEAIMTRENNSTIETYYDSFSKSEGWMLWISFLLSICTLLGSVTLRHFA